MWSLVPVDTNRSMHQYSKKGYFLGVVGRSHAPIEAIMVASVLQNARSLNSFDNGGICWALFYIYMFGMSPTYQEVVAQHLGIGVGFWGGGALAKIVETTCDKK
jgi:hypothetical protein